MALTDWKVIKQSNLVSVIIPCYNHEKFIQATLDSIARDTYPYKEIILINDGSSDHSDQKITEWISSNNNEIKITYVNRKNKGICSTLNELIGIAKGKYILPLASDDCLYGNAIAQRVSVLESSPGKYVLLNDAYVIDENDKIIMDSSADYWGADKSKYQNDEDILRECIEGPKIGGPVIFYNRCIFEEIGLYPEGLQIEDWYFYQRAASKKRILFKDFKVALYRLHGSNFSGVNTSRAKVLAKSIIRVYLLNMSFYPGFSKKMLAFKCLLKNIVWYIKLVLKIK